MIVQVTKDGWGVQVWTEKAEVEHFKKTRFSPIGGHFRKKSEYQMDNTMAAWHDVGSGWFKSAKVFSDKEVKKLFPTLGANMEEGDRKVMTLDIT